MICTSNFVKYTYELFITLVFILIRFSKLQIQFISNIKWIQLIIKPCLIKAN